MGVQQVLRNASALVVDDYVTLRHAVDCDMRAELSEVLRQSNGSVIRREGASTLVRTHDVAHVVERMRAVGCVRGHEWYPLRVRLPRGGGGRACTDPYLRLQPHLVDDGVVAAWAAATTDADDARTRIIVVDDGIRAHTELDVETRFRTTSAAPAGGYHGTSVAGVAAARANGEGICGVATGATVVDINLLADMFLSDVREAMAFAGEHSSWRAVYCNSWGPTDDGRCEQPGALVREAWRKGIADGRSGRGALYVFAAGNGGPHENANADGYANAPETIAVTAVDSSTGRTPSFAEWGACITLGTRGSRVLATTVGGSYTYRYGTSFAAPIVAGAVALMLDANPTLGWRDVQEILMLTARDIDGVANAAGRLYSHSSGAGALRADVAVQLARAWRPLGARHTLTSRIEGPFESRPSLPFVSVHPMREKLRVEHVQVCITASGRGDMLGVTVRSPRGSVGELNRATSRVSRAGCAFTDWCFTSLAHWGEASDGAWVVDFESWSVVSVEYVEVRVFGSYDSHGFFGCA